MITVGILGVIPGVGCTHYAISIATQMVRNRANVAVLDKSDKDEPFTLALGKEIGEIEVGAKYNGDYYSYNKVDYFLRDVGLSAFNREYDFLVVDYGTRISEELLRADYIFLVLSGREWNRGTKIVYDTVEKLDKIVGMDYVTVVVPFASKTTQKEFRDFLPNSKICFPEFDLNPFEYDKRIAKSFDVSFLVTEKKASKELKKLQNFKDKDNIEKAHLLDELAKKENLIKEKEESITSYTNQLSMEQAEKERLAKEQEAIKAKADEDRRKAEAEKQWLLQEQKDKEAELLAKQEEERQKLLAKQEEERQRILAEQEAQRQLLIQRAEEEKARLQAEKEAEAERIRMEKEAEAERIRKEKEEAERLAEEEKQRILAEQERLLKEQEEEKLRILQTKEMEAQRLKQEKEFAEQQRLAEEERARQIAEEKAKAEEEKRKALEELEQRQANQRAIEEARQQALAEAKRAEEEKRLAEEERQKALEEKQKAEQNRDAYAEEKLKDLKAKAEEERLRLIAEAEEKAEQDRQEALEEIARISAIQEMEKQAERERLLKEKEEETERIRLEKEAEKQRLLEEKEKEQAEILERQKAEREALLKAQEEERQKLLEESEAERLRILEEQKQKEAQLLAEQEAERQRILDEKQEAERQAEEERKRLLAEQEAEKERLLREKEAQEELAKAERERLLAEQKEEKARLLAEQAEKERKAEEEKKRILFESEKEKARLREEQVKMASEAERLRKRIAFMSHDEITGCLNRKAFNEALESMEGNFIIVYIDVDGLKSINDIFGHRKGDEVLKDVGTVLKSNYPDDSIYRVGGDEFNVLINIDTKPNFSINKDYILQKVCNDLLKLTKQKSDNIVRTISYGYALSNEELELEDGVEATKSYIVELADKRMYAQKETKPNREGRVVANITALSEKKDPNVYRVIQTDENGTNVSENKPTMSSTLSSMYDTVEITSKDEDRKDHNRIIDTSEKRTLFNDEDEFNIPTFDDEDNDGIPDNVYMPDFEPDDDDGVPFIPTFDESDEDYDEIVRKLREERSNAEPVETTSIINSSDNTAEGENKVTYPLDVAIFGTAPLDSSEEEPMRKHKSAMWYGKVHLAYEFKGKWVESQIWVFVTEYHKPPQPIKTIVAYEDEGDLTASSDWATRHDIEIKGITFNVSARFDKNGQMFISVLPADTSLTDSKKLVIKETNVEIFRGDYTPKCFGLQFNDMEWYPIRQSIDGLTECLVLDTKTGTIGLSTGSEKINKKNYNFVFDGEWFEVFEN